MTTTGFGDVHSYNSVESIISCFALITGAACIIYIYLVLGFIISQVSINLQEYDIKESIQHEKLESLHTFCVF